MPAEKLGPKIGSSTPPPSGKASAFPTWAELKAAWKNPDALPDLIGRVLKGLKTSAQSVKNGGQTFWSKAGPLWDQLQTVATDFAKPKAERQPDSVHQGHLATATVELLKAQLGEVLLDATHVKAVWHGAHEGVKHAWKHIEEAFTKGLDGPGTIEEKIKAAASGAGFAALRHGGMHAIAHYRTKLKELKEQAAAAQPAAEPAVASQDTYQGGGSGRGPIPMPGAGTHEAGQSAGSGPAPGPIVVPPVSGSGGVYGADT